MYFPRLHSSWKLCILIQFQNWNWQVVLMKPTEFAKYLTEFLTTYLAGQKNVSKNTILSYRDTFKLLLKYCQSMKRIPPERITCLLYTSDAADEEDSVDLGGRRIIKKKKQ